MTFGQVGISNPIFFMCHPLHRTFFTDRSLPCLTHWERSFGNWQQRWVAWVSVSATRVKVMDLTVPSSGSHTKWGQKRRRIESVIFKAACHFHPSFYVPFPIFTLFFFQFKKKKIPIYLNSRTPKINAVKSDYIWSLVEVFLFTGSNHEHSTVVFEFYDET